MNAIYAVLEKSMARHSVKLLIDEVIKENITDLGIRLGKTMGEQ